MHPRVSGLAAVTIREGIVVNPIVTVATFTPLPERLPLDLPRDVDARKFNVEVETQLNGGFGAARVNMYAPDVARPLVMPTLPRPMTVRERMHVEISLGGHLIHEGVLWEAEGEGGFSTMGYGLYGPWNDTVFAQTDLATAGVILRQCVRLYAPLASLAATFDDTGALHAWSEFDGRPVNQVLEQLTSEGDGAWPFGWTLYEGRRIAVMRLQPPAVATWRIAPGPGVIPTRSYSGVYDAVRVRYQDAAGATQYTAWAYAAGVDTTSLYLRHTEIDGGALSTTGATQFARTWIAANGTAALSLPISVPEWGDLPLMVGGTRPACLARSGQWVQIDGYGLAVITRTTANLTTGVTNIQLGQPSPQSFVGQLQRVFGTVEAARGGLSPATGARASRQIGG